MKFGSPLYVAVIVCAPNVKLAVWQFATALTSATALQIGVLPSKNVTVPVGTPPKWPATVALIVTGWFKKDGFGEEVTDVVVAAWFTICVNGEALLLLVW